MLGWCTAHPWMTFFIIIVFLGVVDSVLVAFANALGRGRSSKKDDKEDSSGEGLSNGSL